MNEEGGTVILTVSVLSGMLQRPVEIGFSTATTSNDTATGMVCSGISDLFYKRYALLETYRLSRGEFMRIS